MAIIQGSAMQGASRGFYPYEIDQSLRLDHARSTYLTFDPASDGSKDNWTFSTWFKRTDDSARLLFGQGTSGSFNRDIIYLEAPGELQVASYGGSYVFQFVTIAQFKDPSAWYHLVVSYNSADATDTERLRIWVNGERITDFSTNTKPIQNADTAHFGSGSPQYIAKYIDQGTYFNGYVAETHWIDGTTLTPSSFAETKSGVWIPKEYSGSYGTNGFYLKYDGNPNDSSGNGNNFTAYNVGSYDYVPDSPTNNFATMNPLWAYNSANSGTTYSEGNLKYAMTSSNSRGAATMEVLADGCYFEMMAKSSTCAIGVQSIDGQTRYVWNAVNNGELANIGGTDPAGFTDGDIVAVAVGTDGNIKLYKNGTLQGTDNTLTGYTSGDPLVPLLGEFATAASNTIIANFGQDSTFLGNTTAGGNTDDNGIGDFKYAPPSGYLALCTSNLPDPVIDPAQDASPVDYFGILLWSGDDNATRTIQAGGSGVTGDINFTPDFAWIKRRNGATNGSDHMLLDSVRGVGSFNSLSSNGTQAEGFTAAGSNWVNFGDIDAFTTDGFTVQKGSDPSHTLEGINQSGGTYVGWSWKAGGTAVSNTDGSITSTVSANTTSGFSIVKLSDPNNGASYNVGHGLNSPPEMFFIKKTNTTSDWSVYHKDVGNDRRLVLNSTDGQSGSSSVYFGSTTPTSTVVTIGSGLSTGDNWIMYCFHSVDGFSKFGKYDFAVVGSDYQNTSPFVYLGFAPAFLMIKGTSAGREWVMYDKGRKVYNPRYEYLRANSAGTEQTGDPTNHDLDFLSNGFKIRGGSGDINTTNESYIYMAFAENPFKYSNAR